MEKPLILDLGTLYTRAGMGGEDFPAAVVPNVYAAPLDFRFKKRVIPTLDRLVTDFTGESYFFGHDAFERAGVLSLSYGAAAPESTVLPEFLAHLFSQLDVDPSQHPVVYITPPMFGEEQKSRALDLFFRRFRVPKMYFISGPFCALFAMNLQSAAVVGMGERYTTVQSIYRGFPGENSFFESSVNGSTITRYFHKLLNENPTAGGIQFTGEIVREIKEKTVACSVDLEADLSVIDSGSTRFRKEALLPDGTRITLDKERLLASEPYFNPLLVNSTSEPLPDLVLKSLQSWDRTTRAEIFDKIVLCGGCSTIPGLAERLEAEMKKRLPPNTGVKVLAVSGRENIEWIGASVLVAKGLPPDKWHVNESVSGESGASEGAEVSTEPGESEETGGQASDGGGN
ncbi:MAG: actin family protein [Promethearchaeota archaeon]